MARGFTFRLETLLRVRTLRQRDAERRVALQQAEVARCEQLMQQTHAMIEQQQAELLNGQRAGVLDPLALQRGRAWIAHLRKTLADQSRHRAGLQEKLQQRMAELREARTQTRILEKLRERREAEFKKARAKREQNEAEDLAQQLHGRAPTERRTEVITP